MPRLTLIKNPLIPEDKVVFYSQELDLKTFLGKFLFVNPTCKGFLQSNELAVRLNDVLLTDKKSLSNLALKNDDEFVVFPNISTGVETATVVAAAVETAGSAATVAGPVATVAAPSVAATGIVSTNLALAGMSQTAIGALEIGATLAGVGGGGGFLAGAGTMLAEMAITSALSMGVNAMFAPSRSSPSGPTEGSPSYGWDLQTSEKEGIAIPVVYGEHLVGGNVISNAKEYTIQEEWSWKPATGSRKETRSWCAFPFLNQCILGATEPVRGVEVECKLDTPYIFFSYKIWDDTSWSLFWETFVERILTLTEGFMPITTSSQLDTIIYTVNSTVVANLARRDNEATTMLNEIFNNKGIIANLDLVKTTVSTILNEGVQYNTEDINDKLYIPNLSNTIVKQIEAAIKWALVKTKEFIDTVQVNPFDPIAQGSTYTEVFQELAENRGNLGTYVFGCWYINPIGLGWSIDVDYGELMEGIFWLGDVALNNVPIFGAGYDAVKEALADINIDISGKGFDINDIANVQKVALGFHFDVTKVLVPKYPTTVEFLANLKKSDSYEEDISRSQVLHQLTSLSEGECKGLKEVYVEDSPSHSVANLEIAFFKGDNDQNLSVKTPDVNTFDNFNHATKFHSVSNELINKLDYSEFISTENFSVDNIIVETQSTIYKTSGTGHTRPLTRNYFKFAIQVGFSWSDFDAWDGAEAITPLALQAGAFLHQEYELKGQFDTQPTISRFAALPIRDFLMPDANLPLLVTRFPFAALGLCAWLGITFGGEEYAHQRYLTDDTYRDTVLKAIKEKIVSYFLDQGSRIRVRVIRLVPSYDDCGFDNAGAYDFKVTGFQEVAYKGFDYPNTALMGVKFKANSKYNASVPKITTLLKGKKVLVPKLELVDRTKERVYHELAWFDEDVNLYRSRQHNGIKCTYARDSENRIIFVEEWSDNPVWCLYDLITNKRYGLGNYNSQFNLPIDWYLETAEYCDTYVPDGTERHASSITVNTLIDQDSDFFRHGDPYFDDNEEELYIRGTGVFGGAIEDTVNNQVTNIYAKTVAGEALFARTPDGGWTKAVVGQLFRTIPNVVIAQVKAKFLENTYTSTSAREGSEFWTNGLPCADNNNPYYFRYQLGEKRFVLDLVIDSTSSAIDWLKTICDTFRAFPMWVGGGYRPVIDRIKDPVAILGMGNIIKDSLEVSFVPLSKSYNIVEAQFMNKLNMYKRDTRQVVDAEVDVASATDVQNTIRTKQIKLSGITRPSQIVRDLFYRKTDSKLNRKMLSFSMGVEHVNMTAGDIFVFNHSLMTSTTLSGRLQGYDSSSGDKVLLDRDLSALSLPLNISVTLLVGEAYCDECQKTVWLDDDKTIKNENKTTCPYCNGPIDGEEEVVEVAVTSIDGNWVYADFGQVKPVAFNVYEIGPSTETSQKYRVMSIQPDASNVAQISAIEYNKETYGTSRTLIDGVTETAYDDATIATQDNQISLLPPVRPTQPIRNLLIVPYNLLENTVLIKFLAPSSLVSNLLYRGGRISITDSSGLPAMDDLLNVDGNIGVEVVLKDAMEMYKIQVFATYTNDMEAIPVQVNVQLNIFQFDGQVTEYYAPNVPNLRLAPRSRPVGTRLKRSENYHGFISSSPVFRWDACGVSDQDNNLLTPNQIKIDGYELTIELSYSPRANILNNTAVWGTPQTYRVSRWFLERAVDLAEIASKDDEEKPEDALAKVQGVRASVVARTDGNQYSKDVTSEIFWPEEVYSPLKVRAVPILGSVFIWWNEDPDWQDVLKFEVKLTVSRKAVVGGNGNTIWPSYIYEDDNTYETTNRFITIKVPLDELKINTLGILWGCSFDVKIVAITRTGAIRSSRTQTENINSIDDEPALTNTPQESIPDYMLESPASHITVYDTIRPFSTVPNITQQRKTLWQFSTYNERQALIDGQLGSGVEYTGLTWNVFTNEVVRITYESPTEEEFIKIAFNVDKACKVWIEYLKQDDSGDYLYGQWEYLAGNSNGDHELNGDGELTTYDGLLPNAQAKSKYWEVPTGSSAALFPVALKNKYLRLLVAPLDESSTVTVNEIRFTRVGTFDQVSVDLIKNLDWDTGDEKFYLDANAAGLESNEPVFWASDGGIGGTRENPTLELTPTGLVSNNVTGYQVANSGEIGPSGETSWSLVDDYYMKTWTITVNFSSTGYNNITWSAGTLTFANLTPYSIGGGSATIPEDGTTFVYFEKSESTTELQTTNDFSELVRYGLVVICRAIYNSNTTSNASIIGQSIVQPTFTEHEIAPLSIATIHYQPNSITSGEIAHNTIQTIHYEPNSIDYEAVGENAIDTIHIVENAITSVEVAENSIATIAIQQDAVTSGEIATGTVTANEVASNTITANEIAGNTITASEILGGTITANEIAVGTITGDRIQSNTIEAINISGETITANEIASGTIRGDNILAGSISGEHIAGNTIKGDNIFFGTISGEHIASNTITAQVISGETITSNEIAAGTIRGDRIEFGTLSGEHIGANTIKGDNIFFGTISGEHIASNTITAQAISGETITANEIASGTIRGDNIDTNTITASKMNITGGLSTISANVGTLTAGTIRNSANTVSFNLSTGVITINTATGLAVGGSGRITLAPGGDIVFTSCCEMDARSIGGGIYWLDILPVSSTQRIAIGTNTTPWNYVWINGKTYARFMAEDDLDIYCSGGNVDVIGNTATVHSNTGDTTISSNVGSINITAGDDIELTPGATTADQIIVHIPEGNVADSGADGATKVAYRLYAAGSGDTRFLKVTKA